MQDFYQQAPTLDNQYLVDPILRAYLKWKLPKEMLQEIEPELISLGQRVITEILCLGKEAEAQPPRHIPYDPWGRRIDKIEVSAAWKTLDQIAAEEGLIAIGYQRRHAAFSRIHQFTKLYLFHPSSAIYTCPLAMTDGAARAIELYGDDRLKQGAFQHLTSTDPHLFWTSGQWMTERTGGSDVSGTSTIAKMEGETYSLYGCKWFTSATTSQMAMTLARIEGDHSGSKGLSLFYLELRDQQGQLNGIQINRLKDKLGTKALPTAELTLSGCKAQLVGGQGDGVKKISSLFNITRLYNACCAVGYMRRGLVLAQDYARKRQAFGRLLCEQGLHIETLADLQVEYAAAFHLVFHAVELLGKEETGQATKAETAILRLLTPLAKLYTAKQAIAFISEVLECFGGAGYVEDTGLPSLLRDVQVLSIWEGTTNILSLDVLRAIRKENAAEPFLLDIKERLALITLESLNQAKTKAEQALHQLTKYMQSMSQFDEEAQQIAARQFAFSLTRTYIASLLLEHAAWCHQQAINPQMLVIAQRWCDKALVTCFQADEIYQQASKLLVTN